MAELTHDDFWARMNRWARRPRGKHWSASSTKALVAERRNDIEFDGYRFEVEVKGEETSLICLEFRWGDE